MSSHGKVILPLADMMIDKGSCSARAEKLPASLGCSGFVDCQADRIGRCSWVGERHFSKRVRGRLGGRGIRLICGIRRSEGLVRWGW